MEAETAPAQRQGGSYTCSYTVEVAGRKGWRGQRGGGYGIEGEGDGCVTPWCCLASQARTSAVSVST